MTILENTLPAGWTPAAVFFDLDDTLCDYSGARRARLRLAFEAADADRFRRVPAAEMDALIDRSVAIQPHGGDHFPALLAEWGVADPAAAQRATDWYRTHRFHGLRLFSDACDVLSRVRQRASGPARCIGIITNGPADVQREKIDVLGLETRVDFVLVSGAFGASKPDAPIFTHALGLAGVRAEEAVMVGDTLEFDVAGAKRSGLCSIWVDRTHRGRPRPEDRPDAVVTELRDVVALIADACT